MRGQSASGDIVIRCREETVGVVRRDVFVLCRWPETDAYLAGPFQSFTYALTQACLLNRHQAPIWRDVAAQGRSELLQYVTPQ